MSKDLGDLRLRVWRPGLEPAELSFRVPHFVHQTRRSTRWAMILYNAQLLGNQKNNGELRQEFGSPHRLRTLQNAGAWPPSTFRNSGVRSCRSSGASVMSHKYLVSNAGKMVLFPIRGR